MTSIFSFALPSSSASGLTVTLEGIFYYILDKACRDGFHMAVPTCLTGAGMFSVILLRSEASSVSNQVCSL